MSKTEYYLKNKCNGCIKCNTNSRKMIGSCDGKGWTRGADITELCERFVGATHMDIKYLKSLYFGDLIEVIV